MIRTTAIAAVVLSAGAALGQWDAPAGYYSGVTGTGSLLKSQLTSAMSSGHIQRSYGDFRNASRLFDTDPNNSTRILLVYNRASVSGTWDSGNTWNREHVWPQSKQPGSASNSARGNLGDHHALRPCNPSINSSRGNKPFGFGDTTGNFGSVGSYYFPGDTDKGDIARSLFYSATRWSSLGINLVNGFSGSNQMGDLASLMAWHFLDVPDEFERRRNHVIYSQAFNPTYYTNNRNAYVDLPEAAWSVFMDQTNDSQLYVGAVPAANGGSSALAPLDPVLVGGTADGTTTVMLMKNGNDGTYFSVTPGAGATSSLEGKYNAFPITTSGSDMLPIEVGLSGVSTATSGLVTADITIDNLDMTNQAGNGFGALDANDTITVALEILDRANGSFSDAGDVNTLDLDLGAFPLNSGASTPFTIYNLPAGDPAFVADLELLAGSSSGDTAVLTTNFAPATGVDAGGILFNAQLDTSNLGSFSATYTFRTFDDAALAGAAEGALLTLNLSGTVVELNCVADLTTTNTNPGDAGYAQPDGTIDGADIAYYVEQWLLTAPVADVSTTNTNPGEQGYGQPDQTVDGADLAYFVEQWLGQCL